MDKGILIELGSCMLSCTKDPWGSLGANICEFENDVNLSTRTTVLFYTITLKIKFHVICNIFVLQCTNAYTFMKTESAHDKHALKDWRN